MGGCLGKGKWPTVENGRGEEKVRFQAYFCSVFLAMRIADIYMEGSLDFVIRLKTCIRFRFFRASPTSPPYRPFGVPFPPCPWACGMA